MKRPLPGQLLTLAFAFAAFSLLTLVPKLVTSQSGCTNPPTQGANTAWPPNAQVTVNISPGYSQAQRDALTAAFNNWQNSSGNTAGVTFTFTYNSTPITGANTYQVNSQTISGGQAETGGTANGTNTQRSTAFTNIDPRVTNLTALTQVMAHEIGHTFGLADCTNCAAGTSVMTLPPCCNFNDTTSGRTGPSTCDTASANQQYPTPTPTPTATPVTECSEEQANNCGSMGMLVGSPPSCLCNEFHHNDPIIVDVLGDGFSLTDVSNGVNFDIDADGITERLAWTAPGTDDAFLTLDRNGNGTIDNAFELFGDMTPQSPSNRPHGFNALAEYDKPEYGGNGDGAITKADAVFSSLRLWQDTNHNGFSEPAELNSLKRLGLKSIDLDFRRSGRRDKNGNVFRFRSKVKDNRDEQFGRWAWDVFLVSEP